MIIELGGGTGSLIEVIADALPHARAQLWDTDPTMLTVAKSRLIRFGERIQLTGRSFDEIIPPCDAVVSSLALHHVRDIDGKTKIYSRIFEALSNNGIFLNGDATMSSNGVIRR